MVVLSRGYKAGAVMESLTLIDEDNINKKLKKCRMAYIEQYKASFCLRIGG
jgi:hypothetical protein